MRRAEQLQLPRVGLPEQRRPLRRGGAWDPITSREQREAKLARRPERRWVLSPAELCQAAVRVAKHRHCLVVPAQIRQRQPQAGGYGQQSAGSSPEALRRLVPCIAKQRLSLGEFAPGHLGVTEDRGGQERLGMRIA